MNALMMVAALAAGQCDACAVTVEAVVVTEPARACGRRIAPVRNTARFLLKLQPVRRLIRARPVRTFFQHRQPLRRIGRLVLGRCG